MIVQSALARTIGEVFGPFAPVRLEPARELPGPEDLLGGSIQFSGAVKGRIELGFSRVLAERIAEASGGPGPGRIEDALSDLLGKVGASLQSRFSREAIVCDTTVSIGYASLPLGGEDGPVGLETFFFDAGGEPLIVVSALESPGAGGPDTASPEGAARTETQLSADVFESMDLDEEDLLILENETNDPSKYAASPADANPLASMEKTGAETPAALKTPKAAAVVEPVEKSALTGKIKGRWLAATGIFVLLCLFVGIGMKLAKSRPPVVSVPVGAWPGKEVRPDPGALNPAEGQPKAAAAAPVAPPEAEVSSRQAPDPVEEVLAALDREHDALLEKIERIDGFRKEYRQAIGETAGLVKVESAAKRYADFQSAVKDGYIRFSLQTIARRMSDIDSLERPRSELQRAAEALLAERRRVEIDGLMADLLPENGPEARTEKLKAAMERAASIDATVTFDPGLGAPPAIETVWARVMSGALEPKPDPGSVPTISAQNLQIVTELCNGDFSRKSDLTELTPDGARCLEAFSGKDLFLNKLQRLSPESAGFLAGWRGEWLSLNGLRELTEPAAAALSQWGGKWLSLNGLQSLDLAALEHLSKWPGRRLELVGLSALDAWERGGGELMLSEAMREKIAGLKKMKPKAGAPETRGEKP